MRTYTDEQVGKIREWVEGAVRNLNDRYPEAADLIDESAQILSLLDAPEAEGCDCGGYDMGIGKVVHEEGCKATAQEDLMVAWMQGYESGVHDAEHPSLQPAFNPYENPPAHGQAQKEEKCG
jgi:hypothetical protein